MNIHTQDLPAHLQKHPSFVAIPVAAAVGPHEVHHDLCQGQTQVCGGVDGVLGPGTQSVAVLGVGEGGCESEGWGE